MSASPVAAAPARSGAASESAPASHALWEWTKSIVIAVVVWLFLRTFLIEAFRIPSGSMERTLLIGDFLFVNKAVYGAEIPFTGIRLPAARSPARGDVVVFDSVEEEGLKVVKRLIGMPGDTLAMHGGILYRDGKPIDEPYVQHENPGKSESPEYRFKMRSWQVSHLAGGDPDSYNPDLQDWGPIVVPPDSFFMMGDNRDLSYDGRYWGFLPQDNVRGTPLIVYYSYDPGSWKVLRPITAIRWSRLFARPH